VSTAAASGGAQIGLALPTVEPRSDAQTRPAVPRSLFVRLVHQSGLPPSTRLVLLVVAWSAGTDGTGSYLSLAAIASRTGLSARRAQEHLASAVALGWLERSARSGRTNDWVLSAPEAMVDPCDPPQGGGATHRRGGCGPPHP
jgi:hypothetical protein